MFAGLCVSGKGRGRLAGGRAAHQAEQGQLMASCPRNTMRMRASAASLVCVMALCGCAAPPTAVPDVVFRLIAPADGATDVAIDPLFEWQPAAGVESYTLTIVGFGPPIQGIVATSVRLSDLGTGFLDMDTSYQWNVVAVSPSGATANEGGVHSFTAWDGYVDESPRATGVPPRPQVSLSLTAPYDHQIFNTGNITIKGWVTCNVPATVVPVGGGTGSQVINPQIGSFQFSVSLEDGKATVGATVSALNSTGSASDTDTVEVWVDTVAPSEVTF